jgi:hypothetical protein
LSPLLGFFHLPQQAVILRMSSCPEPDDSLIAQNSDRSVTFGNSNGVNGKSRMNPFEIQTGIPRIITK